MANWFNKSDINIDKKNIQKIDDIRGYILPHAGTKFTGHILSHTLKFKPQNFYNNVLILYEPAYNIENIIINENGKSTKYYHEYYVIYETMKYVINHIWKNKQNITFQGINIKKLSPNSYKKNTQITKSQITKSQEIDVKNTLVIASVDFSHFLFLSESIEIDNCGAHSVIFNDENNYCAKHVDTMNVIKMLYNIMSKDIQTQWIGRTKSPGLKGVSYLSFLLREPPNLSLLPDGIFVTSYDKEMRARECLGNWFSNQSPYTKIKEKTLINNVLELSKKTSRLTGGMFLTVPIKYYTVTYLYEDKSVNNTPTSVKNTKNKEKRYIRGWHGLKYESNISGAFYLPTVMLEHVYNNGVWMNKDDKEWPQDINFDMKHTINQLQIKSGLWRNKKQIQPYNLTLYTSKVMNYKL